MGINFLARVYPFHFFLFHRSVTDLFSPWKHGYLWLHLYGQFPRSGVRHLTSVSLRFQPASGSLGELGNRRCWAPPPGCLIYRSGEEQKYLHLQQVPGGAAVSEGRVGESKGEEEGGGYTLRTTLCLVFVPFCLSADLCRIKLRVTPHFTALFLNVNNCPWFPVFFSKYFLSKLQPSFQGSSLSSLFYSSIFFFLTNKLCLVSFPSV